ncbi:LPD28 domain-containing protein [Paenibacillus polymyxa]|uniref:LPD28 domain-containing protein n=1 Tax=Paenibacillus polymyxa TaxID=1406 RepID=UPI0001E6D1DE|nr:LPD28 domain-containing protein [Paenibacillus polymyxa]WPQ59489.1 LPD28 domain-containing protein [Paenibacillus polymyxa]
MEKYIIFEYEGNMVVAKKSPFTKEERLTGVYYYDLEHLEEDEHFPARIVKKNHFKMDYWGSIMSCQPIELVEQYGSWEICEYQEWEDGCEVAVPSVDFVTNVHFYDLRFYHYESESCVIGKSIDFESIMAVWQCIEPYKYSVEALQMDRVWSMPNKNTFDMKPVADLLKEELKGGFIIDPFANRNRYGHITNDLNEKYDTNYHMDALEFLKQFPDESVDVVLFDPPYSARQIKEAYESVGLDTQGGVLTRASYWSNMKKEIARILRVGGKAISFGWNSGGMSNKKLFHINRVRLVPHGGSHNDTIVTISVKVRELLEDSQAKQIELSL